MVAEVARGREIDGAWQDRTTAAASLGVTLDVLDKRFRPAARAAAEKLDDQPSERALGRHLQVYVRALVEAYVSERIERATARLRTRLARLEQAADPDDAALWAGDAEGSPSLERLRKAKAALAELDLQERRGDLVDRHKFEGLLNRNAAILRGAGEALQRHYGPEAQGLLDEALDDADAEIVRHFARYEAGDDEDRPVTAREGESG